MPLQLISPGYHSQQLLLSVTQILSSNTLCSMATRSEAGTVDINAAFFSFDADLTLHFLSHPKAAHCRNLAHVPQMAMTVFDSRQQWGVPHAGLQMFGPGGLVASDQFEHAQACYAARFAGYFDLVIRAGEAGPVTGLAALQLYFFAPTRVKILDEPAFGDNVYIMAEVVR